MVKHPFIIYPLKVVGIAVSSCQRSAVYIKAGIKVQLWWRNQ